MKTKPLKIKFENFLNSLTYEERDLFTHTIKNYYEIKYLKDDE